MNFGEIHSLKKTIFLTAAILAGVFIVLVAQALVWKSHRDQLLTQVLLTASEVAQTGNQNAFFEAVYRHRAAIEELIAERPSLDADLFAARANSANAPICPYLLDVVKQPSYYQQLTDESGAGTAIPAGVSLADLSWKMLVLLGCEP